MLDRLFRLTVALAVAMMLVVSAQTASSEGIAPQSKMDGALRSVFALSAAQASGASGGGPFLLAESIAMYEGGALIDSSTAQTANADGEFEIGLLVKTSGDAGEIAATGAAVGSQIGEIVTARATLDETWRIAGLDSVSALDASVITEPDSVVAPPRRVDSVREPALDETPEIIGAGVWHTGTIDGNGVMLGVIDTGIWPEHPSFRHDGGDSIIHSAWDQTDSGGPAPGCCAYGSYWENSDFNADLQNPSCPPACDVRMTDTNGHGTSVAGAAFGQPFDGTTGIAPGATPIIVKTDFSQGGVLDGVQFMLNQAGLLGQPLIVTLSLGQHFGAHDGTSLFEQGLSGFVDQGVGIVGSAGNDGDKNIHTWFDVTPGSIVQPTIGMPQSEGPTDHLFNFWFDGSDVCLGVETPNGFGTTPVCPGDSTGVDTADGCFFIANTGPDPNNGKHQTIFNPFGDQFGCTDPIAGGDWTLYFDGSDVGVTTKVDGWSADGVPFSNGWGDNRSTVHIPATSPDVFAAGGFVTRETYGAADGQTYSFAPFSETGTLAGFSGRGPNAAGVIKPDITAPGAIIKAPLSQDANLPLANQFPGGQFQAFSGTSMSSPHTAGVMALMRSAYPQASWPQIKSVLTNNSATDGFTGETPNNDWGAGKVSLNGIPYGNNLTLPTVVGGAPYNALWDLSLATTEDGEPSGDCTQDIFNTTWMDISQLPLGQYVTGSRWGDYSGVANFYSGSEFDSLNFYDCDNYAPTEDVRFRGFNRQGPNPPNLVQLGLTSPVNTQSAGGGDALTGPTVEFSISPAQTVPWGDLDCDGDADSVDALKTLQNTAGIAVNQSDCPEFESDAFAVDDDNDGPAVTWGDLDCDGDSDSVDALKSLQNLVGIAVNQPPDCPDLGEEVLVPA